MTKHAKLTRLGHALATAGLIGLPGTALLAQTAAPEAESILVTGSRVMTTKDAASVAIIRVDADAIERSGTKSDVLEILRKSIPALQGRSNTGSSNANNTNQNTAGGSQIQLKNMDTLILVNGRRVAISAIAAIGGKAFVNAGQIPPSAIERIEVLADGASAIYGSDAIGGVINIILKSDYDGAEGGVRYGSASGNYAESSAYFTAGTSNKNYSVTASGTVSHTNPLYQSRRSFTSPKFGGAAVVPGTIGGAAPAILAPGLNSAIDKNPTGTAATANDWRIRPADWPQTRYEAKAVREGRGQNYLRFIKH